MANSLEYPKSQRRVLGYLASCDEPLACFKGRHWTLPMFAPPPEYHPDHPWQWEKASIARPETVSRMEEKGLIAPVDASRLTYVLTRKGLQAAFECSDHWYLSDYFLQSPMNNFRGKQIPARQP